MTLNSSPISPYLNSFRELGRSCITFRDLGFFFSGVCVCGGGGGGGGLE